MKHQDGLTLLELLITLTIAGIMLSVGVPSFTQLLQYHRVETSIDSLYKDLTYARQLAAAYQNSVTVCPLDNNNNCHNDWSNGYTIFVDAGTANQFNSASDELLQTRAEFNEDDYLDAATQYRFSSDGFVSNNTTIRYCATAKDGNHKKELTISVTGVIAKATATSDCT
ncbi:GspH/FimT family pseudopilin [Ferrimonas lipolytica]|uniref:Type II secretion system protein H n=1 Tax=Ferrimonas lipolytica TaxID=2724191 RepID=A0A6H1UI99_9GAMM|nr:GspH/FimT family protein [Ferrimonas lipolytica]QIZ78764.1 prepilin-type N-terminal cleavage/methylation domain-containing protein [Ferrimonas lipolytica]